MARPARGAERGTVTLLAAAGLLALTALLAVVAAALALQGEAHRVQGAADLVALAGARAKSTGSDAPCAAAARAAAADGVDLVACAVSGDELTFAVTVTVRAPGGVPARVAGLVPALEPRATAHAGVRSS
nr:hypothetical protein [Propionibacterium sp.]